jgi:hypothetical protein
VQNSPVERCPKGRPVDRLRRDPGHRSSPDSYRMPPPGHTFPIMPWPAVYDEQANRTVEALGSEEQTTELTRASGPANAVPCH